MTVVETHLFDVVKEIGPELQEAGQEAERERRLPKRAIDLLADAGLQRMFTPQSLGGLEVDPVTCARVIEEVARFDSAAAWALQAGNSGAWWSARLPDEGAQEICGARSERPDGRRLSPAATGDRGRGRLPCHGTWPLGEHGA